MCSNAFKNNYLQYKHHRETDLRVRTILKSPWIFFKFECTGLERVFWCFLVVQDRIWIIAQRDLSLQKVFYARIKTSELKNVEKLVKQTVQALLKSY